MTYIDVEVDGHKYRISKLLPLPQFHLSRRIAPLIISFASEKEAVGENESTNVMEKVAEKLSTLNDDEAEYIVFGLLAAVKRGDGDGKVFHPVANDRTLMYDMSVATMLKLAYESGKYNLGNFLPGQ
jgi:hypothetical protein